MKLSPLEIGRIIFPDKDDEFIDFAIWEKTGFPCFWRIPEDGKTPEDCLMKQLLEFKRTLR